MAPTGDTVHKVDGELLTVGRAEGSGLIIPHETLSRRHLTIRRQGHELFIEDHGSSNGSFLNGKRIKKNLPWPLGADDVITMGEATIKLRARIPVAPSVVERVVPDEGDYEPTMTEIHEPTATAATGPRPIDVAPAPASPAPNAAATSQALAEAQRRATMIITQAEVEAEKLAQDILRRAHEAEAKMDEQYQKRMNEAYRASEQLSQDAQRDARELIDTAKQSAGELRAQAESYVSELRLRTKAECERALEEAHQTARELKTSKLAELTELERTRREEAHAKVKAELDAMEARVNKQVAEEESKRRAAMDALMKTASDEYETLRAEVAKVQATLASERAEFETLHANLIKDRAEFSELEARRATATTEASALRGEVERLTTARAEQETKVREAQTTLVALTKDLTAIDERVTKARAEVDQNIANLKAKFEADRAQGAAIEAQHLEQAKLETTRQARALELRMMNELSEKRDALARELWLNVDQHLKKKGAPADHAVGLEAEVRAVIDRQIAAIAEDDSIKLAQTSLTSLKRRQKWTTALVGATLGGMAVFGGLHVQGLLSGEISPMQRRVAAAQEARLKDLEERKFNPDQSKGYKASYNENVIYGLNFVDVFTSDEFQTALRKDLAPYMLRVWRLDENKVFEAMAISHALVKALAEKRKLINPDTLQKNLDGMKEAEAEAIKRLGETLGGQVRLESYLKFEKTFYDKFDAKTP